MEEPVESVSTEAPMQGHIPIMAEAGPKRRGQPVQVEEAMDGPPAFAEPTEVINLEAKDELPIPTKLAGLADFGAKGGHPAAPEAEAEVAASEARDGEELAGNGEAELTTLRSSPNRDPRKEPRWLPRFSTMDSGRLAECLLERIYLPRFRDQLNREPVARILDATYVSVLQKANEVLTLRNALIQTGDAVKRSQTRLAKYRGWCDELAERLAEAQARKTEMAGKVLAADADRDEWKARFREIEGKAVTELNRNLAAEAKLAILMERLELAKGRVDELTQKLGDTRDQAKTAKDNALTVEERAALAELDAQAAKVRRADAEA